MNPLRILSLLAVSALVLLNSCQPSDSPFVKVENGRFSCAGYPSHYIGTNLSAAVLHVSESGDIERIEKELNDLGGLGINNIRVSVSCPDGMLDEKIACGLDHLLAEMAERGMKAVICLDSPEPVTRVNTVTGKAYNEDPAIFSWHVEGDSGQIGEMAELIKSLDSNHMVSSTSEGCSCPDVDYVTISIMPYEMGWIQGATLKKTVKNVKIKTDEYIDAHLAIAQKYDKPLVLDAFGYPRDNFGLKQEDPVNGRNEYFNHVFGKVVESAKVGGTFAGVNYCEWGGNEETVKDPGLYSVYLSDGWTSLITLTSADNLKKALDPQVDLTILQESNGIFGTAGMNTLSFKARYTENLKADLEIVVETEFGEPVKTVERTVRFIADKEVPFSFDVDMQPGFYKVTVNMLNEDGERKELSRKFVGCQPENIISPKNMQPDFYQFWENTLAELETVRPEYRLTLIPEQSDEVRHTYRVDMKSFGGEAICGIYVEPVAPGKYPVMIHYMGYDTQVWEIDPSENPEMSEFILCVRGQALNKKGDRSGWVKEGISSKETYYYRGAIADVIRAIDFVCSRQKTDLSRVFAQGESQGGAFTLAAASLDDRIKAAAPSSPFLCDMSDFLKLVPWPSNEINEAAQENGMTGEELDRLLSYFDMKNMAGSIKCPILMGVGLQDDICPIHTNFAGYNAVQSEKSWICYPNAKHNVCEQPDWPKAKESFFRKFM